MIILTPNRRLTAFSRREFNEQQLKAGRQCWEAPEIYPIEVWVVLLWNACADHGLDFYKPLLTSKQQQLLFEQIIQDNDVSQGLLRITSTAQNAIAALVFLQQWQIDLDQLQAYAQYSPDTHAFYLWLQAYKQWLTENAYLDLHAMVDVLIANSPSIVQLLPKSLCLRGFNELTPQYQKLVDKWQQLGVGIMQDTLRGPGAQVSRVGFLDSSTEVKAVASWAARELNRNPKQTLGVVIPDLESRRDHIVNAFKQVIAPQHLNISAPRPLSEYDVIATALQILKMAGEALQFSDFSMLLRSPFIQDGITHASARAQLDRYLREVLEARVEFDRIIDLLQEDTTGIKVILEAVRLTLQNLTGKHAPNFWAEKLQKILQAWGWPGEKLRNQSSTVMTEINTNEADLLTCWNGLLDEYCKLSLIIPEHTFSQALQYIRRLANETPFLPAETGLTRVHVLGMLEAEGLIFDRLWVCGMSRDQWPKACNPNPFIPHEIQREYDLPHSSAQRELAMAKKYTANLQQGGRAAVIFSYPQMCEDHKVAPSQLIMHLSETIFDIKQNLAHAPPVKLEVWHDTMTLPYTNSYISGGATSLRLQAQCPFKANAELRLNARRLLDPQIILTPIMRGSLVHEILEKFWRKCESHAQLMLYTPEELEQTLVAIVQSSLETWAHDLPFTLSNNYIMLEAHRLYNLIARWLEFEKGRSNFVVYQLEEKTLIAVGPLQINMKIDRIDQVDGHYVIIDYKTGMTPTHYWFTDPIYEPQLPIYAVSVSQKIGAVAFASLRSNLLKFDGIGATEDLLPGIKVLEEWHSTQEAWQHKLEKTAQDFVNGNAIVAPFSPQVCNVCDLHALCRIYEQ